MTGVVEDGGMKLPFRLDLLAGIDPSRYAGIYQVGPGHFIRITPAYASPWFLLLILSQDNKDFTSPLRG